MPGPKRSHDSNEGADLMSRAMRSIEPFAHWPHPVLDELLKSARLERYKRRTQVLAHDRHRREVLAVVSGCLEISSMSEVGRKYVNALLGAGQVAPLVRLLQDVPLPYDYHAHEDSVIIHLPSDAILAALDTEPVLWRDIARLALKRQRLSVAVLQGQMLGSVRRRIAATMLNLSEFYGLQREADLSLRLRLSQHDLAAMLGLSRQTINKELGWFVEAGVIALRYRHISVLDMELLRKMAASD